MEEIRIEAQHEASKTGFQSDVNHRWFQKKIGKEALDSREAC